MKSFLYGFVFVSILSCAQSPSRNSDTSQNWDSFSKDFLDGHFKAHPEIAARLGRHEFDGQLADFSAAGMQTDIRRLKAALAKMHEFSESSLSDSQKFERQYLMASITSKLFWLTKTDQPYTNPGFFAGNLIPSTYVIFEYAPASVRLQGFIKFARAVPQAMQQIRSVLRPPFPMPLITQGQLVYKGLASYIVDDIPKAFASVADPALQAELAEVSKTSSQALLDMNAWLETEKSRATPSYSLGKDKFQEMLLDTEGVTTSVDELEKVGWQDLDANLAHLKKACAQFASGYSISQCVSKEEDKKPREDMVAVARKQLTELEGFVQSHHVVTIPSSDQALVDQSPPFMRWNTASISRPGVYDKGMKATYYLSPPDPKWSPKERQAYLRSEPHLLVISAHEVWPGHFLDGLYLHNLNPPLGIFGSYAASEGWAHYTEEMMLDMGLRTGDAKVRIAQALEALLRDVRLLSAIGLHTGKMTQAQSETLFLEKAFADPGTAKQQAARGVFDPGYLNYTLGKLMIRKLRDDWCGARGGKAAWSQFHDQYLTYGDAPVPLVRAAMLGNSSGSLF